MPECENGARAERPPGISRPLPGERTEVAAEKPSPPGRGLPRTTIRGLGEGPLPPAEAAGEARRRSVTPGGPPPGLPRKRYRIHTSHFGLSAARPPDLLRPALRLLRQDQCKLLRQAQDRFFRHPGLDPCVDASLDASSIFGAWRGRCGQAQSCVRFPLCGVMCAAGQYGDTRIGSISGSCARGAPDQPGFPDSVSLTVCPYLSPRPACILRQLAAPPVQAAAGAR